MTKTEIIQAAFKVWGEGRYQTTSLSALSASLKVTKAALYHHFKNKEELISAMYNTFFDDMSDCLRPFFDETLAYAEKGNDWSKVITGFLRINSKITEFFARNPCYFIFSLVKVHGNKDLVPDVSARFLERGIDFDKLKRIEDKMCEENVYPSLFQLIFSSSICLLSHFLRIMLTGRQPDVVEITGKVDAFVRHGLNFRQEKIDALDWETLEKAAQWRETCGGGGGKTQVAY